MSISPSSGTPPTGGMSALEQYRQMIGASGASAGGAAPGAATRLQGRNLVFAAGDNLNLSLPQLDADLVDLTPQDPLNTSDMNSYRMHIRGGEAMLTDGQISSFLRSELGDMARNVQDLQIRFLAGNRLSIEGKLTRLRIPMRVEADIRLDENRRIAINASAIRVGGINWLPLMNRLHINAERLVKLNDDQGRYGLSGNGIWINPLRLSTAPVINGDVNSMRTENGFLSIYFGNTTATRPVWLPHDGNFATLTGGRIIDGGMIVSDPRILLRDRTPYDPFNIDDSDGRTTTVNGGTVQIPQSQLQGMVEGAVGSGGDFRIERFQMTSDGARINGLYSNLIPIEIYLRFTRSANGELAIEPHGGKAGFIPIPDGILRSVIGGMLDGARREGNMFVMTAEMLGSTQLGRLMRVSNNQGELRLEL